jgi:hypothetical protein
MQRWVRPSGEMQIVKNWVDPEKRHGFEGYSGNTQYNLLPMSMLALACEQGETTESLKEKPAPADVGGFVFEIPELHKIFANAGGTYVEIDSRADSHYDATGLIRVHIPGIPPQIGPSDSVLAHPAYKADGQHPDASCGAGVSWRDGAGKWQRLGDMDNRKLAANAVLSDIAAAPAKVSFTVTYAGNLPGAAKITERYTLTPGRVELVTKLDDYTGPLRYEWPVLADDGKVKSSISVQGKTIVVSQDGGKAAQTFTASGADKVEVSEDRFPNHNGWARIATAEFSNGGEITLVIARRAKP